MHFRKWLNEAMALRGSYKGGYFQRLVAAAYSLAPKNDPAATQGFQELAEKMSRQHQFLQSKVNFAPQSGFDTFSTRHLRDILDKQRQQGIKKPSLPVLNDPPEEGHPVFSNDQNVQMRGVHDIMGHIYGNHPISSRGEYAAYNQHIKTICNIDDVKAGKCLAAKALFTEVIGQTSYYYIYGNYTVQKAVYLNDFDTWHVGMLSPNSPLNEFFALAGKDLMPRDDFNYNQFADKLPQMANELRRQETLGTSKAPLARLGA